MVGLGFTFWWIIRHEPFLSKFNNLRMKLGPVCVKVGSGPKKHVEEKTYVY